MKGKKLFLTLISAMLSISLLPIGGLSYAVSNDSQTDNYIVVAEDKSDLKFLRHRFGDYVRKSYNLADSNTVKMTLTKTQAAIVKRFYGTKYIEKDILLRASEFEQNGEQLDELLEFIPNNDTEEGEEVYPDSTLMVNGAGYTGSTNINVAVLDSGIANHNELDVTERVGFIPELKIDNNLILYDESGHGTSVAGVIAAKQNNSGIIGIASGVNLYALQVLDCNGEVPLSRIVEGINWAIENNIDVLNMSFGTNVNSIVLYEAIQRAYESGITMVASAGNTNGGATQYPAKYSEVIAVGSVDGYGNVSDFSANDTYVDIFAPGDAVISTGIFNGLVGVSGTSIAAPHITAAAALIKAADETKTNAEIKALLKATANSNNGNRLLDIKNALENIDTDIATEPINNAEIPTYDSDAIATGNWGGTKHASLINTAGSNQGVDNNCIKLMARAAIMADSLYAIVNDNTTAGPKTFFRFAPIHAYGYTSSASSDSLVSYNSNFLADTKYLYRLARYYIESSSISAAETQANINSVTKAGANYSLLQQMVFSKDTIYTLSQLTYPNANNNGTGTTATNVAVKGILHMNIYDGIAEDTLERRAYKILGLAIHLAGDTYAHRVRVPVSSTESGGCFASMPSNTGFTNSHTSAYNATSMNRFLKEPTNTNGNGVCKCFTCFKTAVAAAHVEFRDIKKFNNKNPNYEDDNTFYSKRYTIATTHATNKLISQFINEKDFTLFVFLPSDTSYTLRLNYLRGYIDDTGMNWDGLQQSTRDRVTALSTGSLI